MDVSPRHVVSPLVNDLLLLRVEVASNAACVCADVTGLGVALELGAAVGNHGQAAVTAWKIKKLLRT